VPDAAWRPAEASVQIFGLSREAKDEAVRKAASDVAADEASATTEIKAAAEAKAAAHGKAAAEAKAAAQGKAATEAKAAAAQGKAAAEAKAAAQGKAAAEAKAAADARGAAAQQAEAEAVVTTGTAAGRAWAARVEAAAEEGVDELVVVDEGNLLERERSKIQSKILAMQQEDVGADGPATAWATGSSEAKPAVRRAYEHLIPALDLSDSALYADE
jgi:membrane protein involved in colicin uptake